MKNLMEKSVKNRRGIKVNNSNKKNKSEIPTILLREKPNLPELSEIDVARHFHKLAKKNYCIYDGIYPLGSCTMKYNPVISEEVSENKKFTGTHPLSHEDDVQGTLRIYYELQKWLSQISGLDSFSLQPLAGAHGELTGLMIMKKALGGGRDEVIVPDSSHGTNPASAALLGLKVKVAKSKENGLVDLKNLEELVSENTAGLMLTNPNTLGLFEEEILEAAKIVHDAGGLLYYDGANMNAILDEVKPGEMGFDILHFNLHKSFGTPHGGGGPGSGPVGVTKKLRKYLPKPIVGEKKGRYFFDNDLSESIGRVSGFHGNFGVILRAYCYIKLLGDDGLRRTSQYAVLNARYLQKKIKNFFDMPYKKPCMHECVFSGRRQKHDYGVKTINIAKRMLDYNVHAPTIYFPLIVEESMMIEPTETETKKELDYFVSVLEKISNECSENPKLVLDAPSNTPVGKLDDVKAVKEPKLHW